MNSIEKFLDLYKQLEQVIQTTPEMHCHSVLDFEESLENDPKEKMKVCRILRNYIQHHPDGKQFIAVSDGMMKFLEDMTSTVKSMSEQVKDRCVRIIPVSQDTSVKEALIALSKSRTGSVPIQDKAGSIMGLLTPNLAIKAFAAAPSTAAKIKNVIPKKDLESSLKSCQFLDLNDRLSDIDPKIPAIILSKGKYRGMLRW